MNTILFVYSIEEDKLQKLKEYLQANNISSSTVPFNDVDDDIEDDVDDVEKCECKDNCLNKTPEDCVGEAIIKTLNSLSEYANTISECTMDKAKDKNFLSVLQTELGKLNLLVDYLSIK